MRINNVVYLSILLSCVFICCNKNISEYNSDQNQIATAMEVYKLKSDFKIKVYMKNLSKETKNIILLGEVRDSIFNPSKDVILEVIQNSYHTYSHLKRFKNIVISEMSPTMYTLQKDSINEITLDYYGDFRSDLDLQSGPFKLRAIVIPSKMNIERYYWFQKDSINNLIIDTIKTPFLTIN